jgi:Zn-dependent peptidase ImmA (M78 family)/DNA-binding XRE family transcriptional regulator
VTRDTNDSTGTFAFGGTSEEFRQRVKRLRLVRHWDQTELASRSGFSATLLSQIERGRVAPTAEQVEGIARALGYSPSFLAAELDLGPTSRPWLRAYADASKREADARTAAASIAAEYIRHLDLAPLPDLIPPFVGDLSDDLAIEEAATELRLLADIDADAVVGNAIRAAERLGCVVLPLASELGRHLGMSVRADQIPMLSVAKDNVPGDRQRFTVAHELGHLTLHRHAPPPRDADEASRMEKQANRFAAAFLGPADALLETLNDFGGRVTLTTLTKVKAVWGIAIKGLVGRYRSLGVIDDDHARSLYKQISARKWNKDEPVEVPTESAQWFERTLLRKAGGEDVAVAAAQLAATIGGNGSDLLSFADWRPERMAEVVTLAGRTRRNSR